MTIPQEEPPYRISYAPQPDGSWNCQINAYPERELGTQATNWGSQSAQQAVEGIAIAMAVECERVRGVEQDLNAQLAELQAAVTEMQVKAPTKRGRRR